MFKEYFVLLFLGHILGDFYVQTSKLAAKKEKSMKWVLLHCLCYLGVMLLVSLPIITYEIAFAAAVAAILHLIIDVVKFLYLASIRKKHKMTQVIDRNVFLIDQILHMVSLIGIAYWVVAGGTTINDWKVFKDFFKVVSIPGSLVLCWLLSLLIIHKPANLLIQKLLMLYKPESKEEDKKKDNNAGRFIGTVERIIMLIFLSIGQYSAIGLVLTAKSIARYDKISKEKDFAEYYLLGTLISTAVVIVCAFLI